MHVRCKGCMDQGGACTFCPRCTLSFHLLRRDGPVRWSATAASSTIEGRSSDARILSQALCEKDRQQSVAGRRQTPAAKRGQIQRLESTRNRRRAATGSKRHPNPNPHSCEHPAAHGAVAAVLRCNNPTFHAHTSSLRFTVPAPPAPPLTGPAVRPKNRGAPAGFFFGFGRRDH